MRHNKKFNHLGRTASHRSAMLANMACSLIKHKRITTTLAKAKALKKYVEPLITKSKNDTTNSRRVVFSYLQDKYAVTELFKEIAVKVGDRPGGYTRIIKLGSRMSDAAPMAFIELVDYNENMAKVAKKATRTRRSKKNAAATPAVETPAAEAPAAEEAKAEKSIYSYIKVWAQQKLRPNCFFIYMVAISRSFLLMNTPFIEYPSLTHLYVFVVFIYSESIITIYA